MPRDMGVHPLNRQGTGVDEINAQNLALKISKQGYSETKLICANRGVDAVSAMQNVAHAFWDGFGFYENERKHRAVYARLFNETLFAEAGEEVPCRGPMHDIEYLTVSGSHTAAAINIAKGHVDTNIVLQPLNVVRRRLENAIPNEAGRRAAAVEESEDDMPGLVDSD